jgi:outer membrane protein insertion porin family
LLVAFSTDLKVPMRGRIDAQVSQKLRRLAALSLCSWLAMLAPVKAQAVPPIIAQIRIEGNQRVYKDPILLHIEQEPGQALDPGVVDYDLKSIYKMGFFESVRANLEYIQGQPVLVYTVRERPQIIDVQIYGMNALSRTDSRVVQAVGSINGEILDPPVVKRVIENLKSVYNDEGYINAEVTFTPFPRPDNTVIAIFKVAETPNQQSSRGPR